ncbi:MAG: hypothetical protein JST75_01075 [Bacteroidetes bacterium]|nr:hypothetical protein [Bacteroidota bacterium]
MDLSILIALFTCLLMPIIFYHFYTRDNRLARIWIKYMPIISDQYFSFATPAILAMVIGLRLPLGKRKINKDPKMYLENVKKYLQTRGNLGLILIAIGVASSLLDFLSPSNLRYVFYLLDHLTYVGVFYVFYSHSKRKHLIVPGVILLMITQSIITGMFGELIFMLACSLVLILLGKKIRFERKLAYVIAGIFLIVVIQSIKLDYRKRSWLEGTGADPLYFAELISDRISDPSTMIEEKALFGIAVRMNQGWLVATTMDRVPAKFPFANGETIWKSVAAAILPRFLWPDKPDAGGKSNIKRFWGFNLVGYSMNIGPLGEAYGNFGIVGGVFYMFFYGLFFNIALSWILKLAEKRPTLILWLPFLFFYAIGVETDLLTTMGSLIKAAFFTWLVFRLFHIAFRIDL